MRILYLTAGAAGMYCGSCLRDNALAAELIRQGHDVTLVPLYTPTRTDEPNVSQEKVLFGGISVYLEQHSSFFRRTPRWLDKLWDSGLALRAASKSSIAVDPSALGELTISMLKGEDGHQRKEFFKLVDWLKTHPPPDVVDLQNSMLIGLARPIKQTLGAPVCCTLQGEDLFINNLSEPYRAEAIRLIRENSKHVDVFIAISEFYADFMAEFLSIPRSKIQVVPLGINLKDHGLKDHGLKDHKSKSNEQPEVFRLGYFARVAPEKGLHVLAEAYQLLRKRSDFGPARLDAAGYLAPEHKPYLQKIEAEMRAAGLGDEFTYHGTLDRTDKLRFLQNIDALSMPTTYAEPKGLPILEAMANGVPVAQPDWGSFPEMIERTGGGLLFASGNSVGLADAIHALWKNPELARDLGRRGITGVATHYSVERMADGALEVYQNVRAKVANA